MSKRLPDDFIFEANVTEAGLHIPLLEAFRIGLKRFLGTKVIVIVRAWSPKRSVQANAYYWAVLVRSFSDYTGYSKRETHQIFKEKFATEIRFLVNEATGVIVDEVEITVSTATMVRSRFSEFVDSCTQLCVQMGIELPPYEGDRYAQ
jgi:cytosine/uracil/thiamine/allantoin permease